VSGRPPRGGSGADRIAIGMLALLLACPLETSAPIVRHYSTVFFDSALMGEGPGVEAGVFAEADAR
jgi:hypothetical protein